VGADLMWAIKRWPLDIRSEFISSKEAGRSYWVEGAYRLNRLGNGSLFRNTQVVFRQEQYFLPGNPAFASLVSDRFDLPDVNTKRSTGGLNYYLNQNIRLNGSYGGNYATGENSHVWNVGFTYRFTTL
jgi:hypothetical protein